jgi:hypothetical protein
MGGGTQPDRSSRENTPLMPPLTRRSDQSGPPAPSAAYSAARQILENSGRGPCVRPARSLALQSTETTIEEDDEGEDDAAAASFVRSARLDVYALMQSCCHADMHRSPRSRVSSWPCNLPAGRPAAQLLPPDAIVAPCCCHHHPFNRLFLLFCRST